MSYLILSGCVVFNCIKNRINENPRVPIKNPQTHNKCSALCLKSHPSHRLSYSYRVTEAAKLYYFKFRNHLQNHTNPHVKKTTIPSIPGNLLGASNDNGPRDLIDWATNTIRNWWIHARVPSLVGSSLKSLESPPDSKRI